MLECSVFAYRSVELNMTSGPNLFYRWTNRWHGAVSLTPASYEQVAVSRQKAVSWLHMHCFQCFAKDAHVPNWCCPV